MLVLLSPSKSQDFSPKDKSEAPKSTKPTFSTKAEFLVHVMQQKTAADLQNLMRISPKLATLNVLRYEQWNEAKVESALHAFTGHVYQSFVLESYTKDDYAYAQKHLRTLSGLYGILRPLDMIKPHRLEMGTRIAFDVEKESYKGLYQYWSETVTHSLDQEAEGGIINLASNEYSKVIDRKILTTDIIDVEFKVEKNGKYSTVAVYAKQARGMMASLIIKGRVEEIKSLKKLKPLDFAFNKTESTDSTLVFTRKST